MLRGRFFGETHFRRFAPAGFLILRCCRRALIRRVIEELIQSVGLKHFVPTDLDLVDPADDIAAVNFSEGCIQRERAIENIRSRSTAEILGDD